MTVPANLNRVDYTGTGSAGPFSVPFPFYDASHLTVLQTDALFNQTTLTGWTATGAGGPSGAVTLAAACPVGSTLTIMRIVPLTQITSIKNQEAFFPEVHEQEMDLLAMADQQLDEAMDRTLRLPAGLSGVDMTLPRPDPGHALVWNAAGDGLENAGAASATLQQDLADSADVAKGDEMIAVKQPFTGAVARTQHDKNADKYSVRDFGAVGDGTVDDTAAIQKCIDNGGSVYFPKGFYRVDGELILPKRSLYTSDRNHFYGDGGATIVVNRDSPIIRCGLTNTDFTSKWVFSGLIFTKGPDATTPQVFLGNTIFNSVIRECSFINMNTVVFVTADQYSQSLTIINNNFASCGYCFYAEWAFNFTFQGNFCEGCTQGIYLNGGDGQNPTVLNMRIIGNCIEGGGQAISLGSVLGGVIENNYFEANGSAPCEIKLDNGTLFNHRALKISGNTFIPSASQLANPSYYPILVSNALIYEKAPIQITGNITSNARLSNALASRAIYENNVIGSGNGDQRSEIPVRDNVNWNFRVRQSYVSGGNRTTAFSAGIWKVFKITPSDSTVYEISGNLQSYTLGGYLRGKAFVNLKFSVHRDFNGNFSVYEMSPLKIKNVTGALSSGKNYFTFWNESTSVASYSIDSGNLVVSINNFSDHADPDWGNIYANIFQGSINASCVNYSNISVLQY